MIISALPKDTPVTLLYFPADAATCIERNHREPRYKDKTIKSLAQKVELPAVDEANNGLIIVC